MKPSRPRVSRVHIENFRSIRKLEMDLPPFAVLVGPNSSGKTNFVQALSLLGKVLQHGSTEPVEAMGWDEVVRRTKKRAHHLVLGVRVDLPMRPAIGPDESMPERPPVTVEVEIDLRRGGEGDVIVRGERLRVAMDNGELEIVLADENVRVRAHGPPELADWTLPKPMSRVHRGERPLRFEDGATEYLQEVLADYFLPGRRPDEQAQRYLRLLALHRFHGGLVGAVVAACQITRLRLDATALRSDSPAKGRMGGAGKGLAAAVAELRGMRDKPKRGFLPILEALQEVFPRIEDVVPIRSQPGRLALSFKERGVKDAFGQASVSDGLLHALALLVALGPSSRRDLWNARRRGLLAIEEPENAIHPWSIRVLMHRIQDLGREQRQILLTTHSVEVVNQVGDPNALLICEVGDDGTHLVPATTRETALASIMTETGERLGDMWQSGSLGGVP